MARVLFVNSNTHHLFGQQHLMRRAVEEGHEVILHMPDEGNYFVKLQQLGYQCLHLQINSKSLNPFDDLKLCWRLRSCFKQLLPDIVFSYTIKPNLYAAIAAQQLKIPIIANVTGLGYVFMRGGVIAAITLRLYRLAFRRNTFVFCQNETDCKLLQEYEILKDAQKFAIIPGSGVNLTQFPCVGLKPKANLRFLYSGRLLWDKGLGELAKAFAQVKLAYPQVELLLIGSYFPANPSAISEKQIQEWQAQGILTYAGMVDNVQDFVADCDCVILPSYREGMPRSLLEACSMGKPIISVNSVGCRDVVVDNENGFMAEVKDVPSLAAAIIKFIELPFSAKVRLGINGRQKMEDEFDQQIVVKKYFDVTKLMLKS